MDTSLHVEACTLAFLLRKLGLLRTNNNLLAVLRTQNRPWISEPEDSNNYLLQLYEDSTFLDSMLISLCKNMQIVRDEEEVTNAILFLSLVQDPQLKSLGIAYFILNMGLVSHLERNIMALD
jgi:hypothetical protein